MVRLVRLVPVFLLALAGCSPDPDDASLRVPEHLAGRSCRMSAELDALDGFDPDSATEAQCDAARAVVNEALRCSSLGDGTGWDVAGQMFDLAARYENDGRYEDAVLTAIDGALVARPHAAADPEVVRVIAVAWERLNLERAARLLPKVPEPRREAIRTVAQSLRTRGYDLDFSGDETGLYRRHRDSGFLPSPRIPEALKIYAFAGEHQFRADQARLQILAELARDEPTAANGN